jgi:hypothetical protein
MSRRSFGPIWQPEGEWSELDHLGKDPPSMLLLALLMLLILVIASGVVLYVAFPHRGEDVPGAPWLGDAMQRGVDTIGDLLDRQGADDDRQPSHR